MNKNSHAKLLAAGVAGIASLALSAAGTPQSAIPAPHADAPPARPNIILVLMDDMGYGDIGSFGSTKNRTPHLDRMAAEGMRLTSFYVAPVCTPSRAQFMTGCYAKRVSLPNVIGPVSSRGISAKEHTVAELLKQQGYATMCIGKWHLGDQPKFLPTKHGFDAYFGLPYSNDMGGPADAAPDAVRVGKGGKKKKSLPPPLPLVRNDQAIEVITDEKQDHLLERYTDAAIKFIRDHVAANVAQTAKSADGGSAAAPFFLYLPHTAVHKPLHPSAKFRGKSANGPYGDWVEETDWSMGRILDTLRELGIAENTLVIFTSDNGPYQLQPGKGGVAGPLRGAKRSTFEGGMRVATLAWWPGKIPAGSSSDAITGGIDILPTFVALAGGTVPKDNKIDGVDISSVLLGKANAKESARNVHYYFSSNTLQAVRQGPWKLAIVRQNEATSEATGSSHRYDPKYAPRLYNLDNDIGERRDVAARHPEIVAQLQALVAAMDKDLGIEKLGPGVRAAGSVENPTGLWVKGRDPLKEIVAAFYD